ncbi:MAG: ABC transporter substrate-binding protein [Clostridia bacterium]|nr:ABC transporter substrate-binding protein [Clostridia bacterium]
MKRIFCLLLCMAMTVTLLAGCGGEEKTAGDEITLRWYARINKEADCDEVFEKASAMVKENLGFNIDIIPLEDYNTKMPVIAASGEDYDIVYTASAVNNYYQNASDGNFLELDELLPEFAPTLWNDIEESVWDSVRASDGKIYGIPNQQIFARAPGFLIPTQNIEVLGLDVEAMQNWTVADYEEYFRLIKEKTGEYGYFAHAWNGDGAQREGFQLIFGSNLPGAIRYNDEAFEVVNQYETPEFENYIKARAKFVNDGLVAPMEVTENDIPKYATPKNGVIPWLITMATYLPGCEANYKTNYGFDVTVVTRSEALLTSYGTTATMAAVNADTRYPEESVKFLEFLNTNKEFYNLITFGIEGKHYTKIDDNYIQKSTENPYSQPAWAIGNTFNAYLLEGQPLTLAEDTKKINSEAKVSPILGFIPDQDSLKVEVASCKAVLEEYLSVLDQGIVDVDGTYATFIEKLKSAGVDKIIESLNKQLAEWKANNKQ